jgi:hypothetical protein
MEHTLSGGLCLVQQDFVHMTVSVRKFKNELEANGMILHMIVLESENTRIQDFVRMEWTMSA